jgi:hypothetical protein
MKPGGHRRGRPYTQSRCPVNTDQIAGICGTVVCVLLLLNFFALNFIRTRHEPVIVPGISLESPGIRGNVGAYLAPDPDADSSGASGAKFQLTPDLQAKAVENDRNIIPGSPANEIGYLKRPTLPDGPRQHDDGLLHIIFSSGCNYFQHWQSEMLLATAHMIGQRGRVTRIVSGCHDKKAENIAHEHQTFPGGKNDMLVPIDEMLKSVNPNFGLYITPSFEEARNFPWINKPSSIDYFMRNARDELDKYGETVIAILDPDFVFIRPLTQVPQAPNDMIRTRSEAKFGDNVVVKGRPVAQRYGLEAGWVRKFPVADIIGDPNSHALTYTSHTAANLFSVGPPLILHVDDLTNLAVLWSQYMRPVLKIETDILADMWAYCMAAAHLKLEHVILDHYMISTTGSVGEGFKWVDEWENTKMSCHAPPRTPPPGLHAPTFLHLASNFKAPLSKEWMFHKGHVPASILDCGSPLIKEAPDDLYDISEREKHTKQHAWIICNAVSRLNDMLLRHKQKYCPAGFEQRKLVRLIQRKTMDKSCDEKRDKWCYPLAQIEGLPAGWRNTADGKW